MNIKSSSEIVREPAERKSPDLGNTLQKHSNTHIKNRKHDLIKTISD